MSTLRSIAALVSLAVVVACAGGAPAASPGATPSTAPNAVPTTPRSAAPANPASPSAPGTVTLLTHDSFAVSDEVLAAFQAQTGTRVEVLRAGDAGAMVNQAILTKAAPLADVVFGVDNTFLSRALDADIFEEYESPAANDVPADLKLDATNRVTPIDYGDVCVNTDKAAFVDSPAPQTLDELADPAYEGDLVVQNPATSSVGLAFMLATIGRFGESGDYTWLQYWADLRANDVLVVSGWEEAYYGQFSGGAGEGDRPLVVSYATSPAAEVAFADPPPAEASTDVLEDGCFRQIEFAGVLRGARNPAPARQLVDFMLSPEFQADIPLNMFVFPALADVDVPAVFAENSATIAEPLTMAPSEIAANRERWQQEWTDVVLR
jgi:thiamine transport system substrate-binding protein